MIASALVWWATFHPKMGWKLRWPDHFVLQLIQCFRSRKTGKAASLWPASYGLGFFFLWNIPFAVQAKTRKETFLTLRVWHKPTKLNSQDWSEAGFTVLRRLSFVPSLTVHYSQGKLCKLKANRQKQIQLPLSELKSMQVRTTWY